MSNPSKSPRAEALGRPARSAWTHAAVAAALLGLAASAQADPHSCKKVGKDEVLSPGLTPVDFAATSLEDRPAGDPGTLKYTTYAYGSVLWREPSLHCFVVGQTFDFYEGSGKSDQPRPTIVYFHGNGSSSHVLTSSPTYINLIVPAVKAGFNVASVEYRHPVTDEYLAQWEGGVVPTLDTGYAMQYLRDNAGKLNISQANVFSFGHSRGTLALWQAMQPDMGGGTTGMPSSLPQAYFGFGPQTTYQCQEFSTLFFVQDADAAAEVANCEATNEYWQQFGSAVDSVTASAPPVHLQADGPFVLQKGTQDQIELLTYAQFQKQKFSTGHYPDYAIAMLDAFERVGNPGMDYPEQNVKGKNAFVGWQNFIYPLIQSDASSLPSTSSGK